VVSKGVFGDDGSLPSWYRAGQAMPSGFTFENPLGFAEAVYGSALARAKIEALCFQVKLAQAAEKRSYVFLSFLWLLSADSIAAGSLRALRISLSMMWVGRDG